MKSEFTDDELDDEILQRRRRDSLFADIATLNEVLHRLENVKGNDTFVALFRARQCLRQVIASLEEGVWS